MSTSPLPRAPSATLPEVPRDIVLLAAVEWDTVAQAQHLLTVRMAQHGRRIIFVEPIPHRLPRLGEVRRVLRRLQRHPTSNTDEAQGPVDLPPGVTVVSPFALPENVAVFRWLNRAIFLPLVARRIRSALRSQPVVQVWKPLDGFRFLSQRLRPRRRVYSCIDNYAHSRAPKHFAAVEVDLVRSSDLVVANSPTVRERLLQLRPSVELRNAGVDFGLFARSDTGPVQDVRTLVYHGVISDRLDFDLITGLAERGFEVHLIGPVKRCPLDPERPPNNVFFHGLARYDELPSLLRQFDAFLLPYAINDYTKHIRPAKMYECFASGRPVFATPITSLYRYEDLIRFASTGPSIAALVEAYASQSSDAKAKEHDARVEEARLHDWSHVVEQELAWLDPEAPVPAGAAAC